MKVKTLIKFLLKQNPEYFVCRKDYGLDSGDLMNIRDDEIIISDKPDNWYARYGDDCKEIKE